MIGLNFLLQWFLTIISISQIEDTGIIFTDFLFKNIYL